MYRMSNNKQQPRINLYILKQYVGVCLYIEHTTHTVFIIAVLWWRQLPSLNIAPLEGSVNLPCITSELIQYVAE